MQQSKSRLRPEYLIQNRIQVILTNIATREDKGIRRL